MTVIYRMFVYDLVIRADKIVLSDEILGAYHINPIILTFNII